MHTQLCTLFLAIGMTGCSSIPQLQAGSAGQPAVSHFEQVSTKVSHDHRGTQCRLEKLTGTNIATTVCRTAAQREADREHAVQFMRAVLTGYR